MLIERADKGNVRKWRSMLVATEVIFTYLEKKLLQKGSSYPRLRILFYIYAQGPLSAAELAEKMMVSRANMSTFIKRLLDDKTIIECPDTSKPRRPRFMMSQKGEKDYEKLLNYHLNNIEALPLSIDVREIDKLNAITEKVRLLIKDL